MRITCSTAGKRGGIARARRQTPAQRKALARLAGLHRGIGAIAVASGRAAKPRKRLRSET